MVRALPSRRAAWAAVTAGLVLAACTAPAPRPGGAPEHHDHGGTPQSGRSVTDLVDPSPGPADVAFDLVARTAPVTLSTGAVIDAWTFNGTAPGPQLTVRRGQLVQVTLHNEDIAAGVTVHWHGLDVPNAMDGVAGVTQEAIAPGGTFVYRFRPLQAGTFWYHTHQDSSVGVPRGLFGAFVVLPEAPAQAPGIDDVLVAHTWSQRARPDVTAIGTDAGWSVRVVEPGTPVRLRLINTDSLPQHWAVGGTAFAVVAVDGMDVVGPTPLRDRTLTLGAGGRYDIAFAMPDAAVAVGLLDGNRPAQVLRPPGSGSIPELAGGPVFDALTYGTPTAGPFSMDSAFDVDQVQLLETHRTSKRGVPSTYWTINGKRAPDIPMILVTDGDVVRVHIVNASDTIHPMHLHGHHVLVLQRNGVRASGSPWWADTVELDPGDDVWVAFRADNPGIWMDHCHNLAHAAAGMLMHLAYRGITTPFHVGGHNRSE